MKCSKKGDITQKWVNLLIPFSNNYNAKFTASQLTKETNIPQQTTSRYTDKLVKLNILSYKKEGRNKSFYFNKDLNSKIIFNIIENQKALDFMTTNKNIAIIIKKLMQECETLIVFGSYASKKFKIDSDLDILIIGNKEKKKIKNIKNRNKIKINEHYISYSELSRSLKAKKPLAIEIKTNHIFFGNASKLVDIFQDE